jgi:hypothetical protein
VTASPLSRFVSALGALVDVPVYRDGTPRTFGTPSAWIEVSLLASAPIAVRPAVRYVELPEDEAAHGDPPGLSPDLEERVTEAVELSARVRCLSPTVSDVPLILLAELSARLGSPMGSEVLEANGLGLRRVLAGPSALPWNFDGRDRSVAFLDVGLHATMSLVTRTVDPIDRVYLRRT